MLAESAVQHTQTALTCTHPVSAEVHWHYGLWGFQLFSKANKSLHHPYCQAKSMFTCKHAAPLQGKDKDVPAAGSPGARWELPTGCSVPSSRLRLSGGACSTARQCTYSGQLFHGSLTPLCTAGSLGASPHALSHLAPDGSSRNYWESKQWSKN